jgi:hypothetical protein
MTAFDWENCSCYELGYQICSHYENFCSDRETEEWYNSLSEEEKASLNVVLCDNCYRGFEEYDPDNTICPDCVDWLDVYEEFGINF